MTIGRSFILFNRFLPIVLIPDAPIIYTETTDSEAILFIADRYTSSTISSEKNIEIFAGYTMNRFYSRLDLAMQIIFDKHPTQFLLPARIF